MPKEKLKKDSIYMEISRETFGPWWLQLLEYAVWIIVTIAVILVAKCI